MSYEYNLGQFFTRIAKENKSGIALRMAKGKSVTFLELENESNQIAFFLRSKGIASGQVLGILNNKTSTAYATMLACLKEGIIYTNLDPKSPVERFKKMLDLCQPKCIFYSSVDSHGLLNEVQNGTWFNVDYSSLDLKEQIQKSAIGDWSLNSSVTSTHPAYIMFTSGSTGFPKGVLISHGSILNFIHWSRETFGITKKDALTSLNPMHFDNSVFDFYASLFNGATLIPAGEDLMINPKKLLDELNVLKPTIWFSVPSLLVYALNVRSLKSTDLPTLRVVVFGGEGFPKNKLRELWEKWGGRMRFVNVYGPTEGTCICSSYVVLEQDLEKDDLLPLGPIAPNFSAYILDENGCRINEEGTGELCIAGPNLALGYFNNPTKTSEVFIQNPFVHSHSERLYKTGDLVAFDKELNSFIFKGRKDNQIKRMGYRIELEEIENALNAIEFIEEAAVIYINNQKLKSKIMACIKSSVQDELKIKNELVRYLPQYMMPDAFYYHDFLPKNQNGKIDRSALKALFHE